MAAQARIRFPELSNLTINFSGLYGDAVADCHTLIAAVLAGQFVIEVQNEEWVKAP